jgi:hypothetical protein
LFQWSYQAIYDCPFVWVSCNGGRWPTPIMLRQGRERAAMASVGVAGQGDTAEFLLYSPVSSLFGFSVLLCAPSSKNQMVLYIF